MQSNDWLVKFKAHHGIWELDICEEKLSVDGTAVETFRADFNKFFNNEEYGSANIYNVDEIGLIWEALLQKTLVSRCERSVAGCKVSEERIIAFLCANATGCH